MHPILNQVPVFSLVIFNAGENLKLNGLDIDLILISHSLILNFEKVFNQIFASLKDQIGPNTYFFYQNCNLYQF